MVFLSRMCVECGKDVDLTEANLLANGQRVCRPKCAKRRERRKQAEKRGGRGDQYRMKGGR